MEKHDFLFKKVESIAFQISAEQSSLFYATLLAKYNPSATQYPSLLWEFYPESNIVGEPFYFQNHYNGLKEVFVQDKQERIYLISTIGKLLWKKQLPSAITGKIYQVDAFKNGKYQLLFSTQERVYLIDRNGKNVEGFPLPIKGGVSAQGLQLIDYDHNKNYRLIVPSKSKKVYNFTIEGLAVEGWNFTGITNEIVSDFKHIAIDGKDYLVSIDIKGRVYVVDRRGQSRLAMNKKVALSGNNYQLVKAASIEKSFINYTDNIGQIHHLYFDGKQASFSTEKEYLSDHYFNRINVDQQKGAEYVYANDKQLEVYDQSLKRIYAFEGEQSISTMPKPYAFENGIQVGFASEKANLIYLLNEQGHLYTSFPLEGNTAFSISRSC